MAKERAAPLAPPLFGIFDLRFWFFLPVFGAAVVLRMFEIGTFLAFALVATYALFGLRQAVLAFVMSWFLTISNPGVFADTEAVSFLRYAVLISGLTSLGIQSLRPLPSSRSTWKFSAFVAGLTALICAHSLAFSEFPDMSFIKAMFWGLATWIVVACFARMDEPTWRLAGEQLFVLVSIVVVLSLPLIVTDFGYEQNNRGFQGLTNHSMVFGSTCALVALMAFGRMFAGWKPKAALIALLAICLVSAIASQSRTGLFAVAITLFVVGPIFFIRWLTRPLDERDFNAASQRMMWVFGIAILSAIVIAVMLTANPATATSAYDTFLGGLMEFLSKSGRDNVSTLLDAYESSRGEVIYLMKQNIAAVPWTGIGFGVPSELTAVEVAYDPFFGFIVSMPVEKGVGPYAIVEELGVPLALLVFALWGLMLKLSFRAGIDGLLLVTGILLLNAAEYTFFAPGGMGMAQLVLGAWACCRPRLTLPEAGRRAPAAARPSAYPYPAEHATLRA